MKNISFQLFSFHFFFFSVFAALFIYCYYSHHGDCCVRSEFEYHTASSSPRIIHLQIGLIALLNCRVAPEIVLDAPKSNGSGDCFACAASPRARPLANKTAECKQRRATNLNLVENIVSFGFNYPGSMPMRNAANVCAPLRVFHTSCAIRLSPIQSLINYPRQCFN